MIAAALPVVAGPFEDAVGKFANDEFSDTEEAVGVLATGGNPLAYTIISALQDGRLMADPTPRRSMSPSPTARALTLRPARRLPAFPTAPRLYGSTTACAAPSRPRSVV